MAQVEVYSGGQVKIRNGQGKYVYGFGHWQLRQRDNTRLQLIHIAHRIINTLFVEGVPERIEGVIAKATGGRIVDTGDLDDLDEPEARKVVHALRAIAKRHEILLIQGGQA